MKIETLGLVTVRCRSFTGLGESALVREHNRLHPIANIGLQQNGRYVRLDGCFADDQLGGYFPIGQSLYDENEYAAFTAGQSLYQLGTVDSSRAGCEP